MTKQDLLYIIILLLLMTACLPYRKHESTTAEVNKDNNPWIFAGRRSFDNSRARYLADDLGQNLGIYNGALQQHGAVVISVCNTMKPHFCEFLTSARSYNAFVHVINYGFPWKNNREKLYVMKEAVHKYTNDTIIIFTDCMDVVFNNEMNFAVNLFRVKGSKFVVSVEHNCWPNEILYVLEPNAQPPGNCYRAYNLIGSNNNCFIRGPRYVNSGTYIAYAGVLKDALTYLCDEVAPKNPRWVDDQRYFHEIFLLGKYGIELDHCVEFFMTMYNIEDVCQPNCKERPWVRMREDHLVHTPTHTRPTFVHFNGRSKELYNKYINSTITSKVPKATYDTPMLWVNQAPKKIEDLCLIKF